MGGVAGSVNNKPVAAPPRKTVSWISGHLPPDKASQARSAQILQRIDKIIVQTT